MNGVKRCRICGCRLDDYDSKCDTCGACINMNYKCACGQCGEKGNEKERKDR